MICPQCQSPNADNAKFCGACGVALNSTPTFTEQQTIDPGAAKPAPDGPQIIAPGAMVADRYKIIAEIGRGMMGAVYKATDTLADRDVALKLIRTDRLAGKDAARRVIRESLKVRDIRHPNVVAVYDAGEVQGMPFIAMELAPGQSLYALNRQKLANGAEWPAPAVMAVVRQIAQALAAAHAKGVIHRDLKPSSIEVVSAPDAALPEIKVNDFGITSASGVMETGATSPATTPYRAPEQLTAPEAAHPPADFYSLSVMFYEMLVGTVPQGHWQPPSESRPEVLPAIDKLIERGLSNNPRNRPQSAAEFLAALDEATNAPGPQPPKPAPAPHPPKPPQEELDGGPKPDPAPQPPPAPPAAKPALNKTMRMVLFGGVAVIGLVAIVSGVMQMVNAGKSNVTQNFTRSDGGGKDSGGLAPDRDKGVQPAPTPLPPPPPPRPSPPTGPNYSAMSGYWTDDFYNVIQVRVTNGGTVTGQFSSGPLAGYNLAGQFNGYNFQYQIGTALGVAGGSVGAFDGACHIRYQLTDAFGNPAGTAQLHINHQPGAPCP
jgi:serine/threonine protein kinase